MDKIKKILQSIYTAPKLSHKGQNGTLLIIGGSRQYHGAPMFSILAARRFVDLLYFYPGENDSYLLNAIKTIPEVMVVHSFDRVFNCDCVLFGIGLADARLDVGFIIKNAKKVVIDGDGLSRIKDQLSMLALKPKFAILTPHELEFDRLFGCPGTKENVRKMADRYGVVILKKGPAGDIISDGKRTEIITGGNPGMTKGGTGDVLAGLVAALFCKNPAFESAIAASYLNRKTGDSLKKQFGLNYCASDLANALANTLAGAYEK